MTPAKTLHMTLDFEREIPAPVEEVFAAFADPVARAAWRAPSDTAVLIYDEADFREGGQDCFRCGSKADPNIHGVTRYLDIIANRRVVSSETIVVNWERNPYQQHDYRGALYRRQINSREPRACGPHRESPSHVTRC
jgi:uncharacterized protein YndB with AHSA1/START domain